MRRFADDVQSAPGMFTRTTAAADAYVAAPGSAEAELSRLCRTLGSILRARFIREEAPAGFLAFLCLASPRYLGMMTWLREEHARLLVEIDALAVHAAHARPVEWPALLDAFHAYIAHLDAHEAVERAVLRDALEAEV